MINRFILVLLSSLLSLFLPIMGSETHVVEEIDPYGNVIQYIRDESDRLIEVFYPPVLTAANLNETEVTQFRESYTYDERGNLIEYRDGNGHSTLASYDDLSSPLLIQYPDGTKELFTYFPDGTLESSTDRSGSLREYQINGDGEIIDVRITNRNGNEKNISLDGSQDPHSSLNSGIHSNELNKELPSEDSFTVNSLGQFVRQVKIFDGSSTSSYTYNTMGRLETKTVDDLAGNLLFQETFLYDGNGNCTLWKKESDHVLESVRNFYGPCGRIEISVENFETPEETTTHYLYNEYGEPVWSDSTKDVKDVDDEFIPNNPEAADTASNIQSNYDDYMNTFAETTKEFFKNIFHSVSQLPSAPAAIIDWFKAPNPYYPEHTEEVSWLRWTLNHFLKWKEANNVGIIGKGELGNYVRITYINGMLNTSHEVLGYLKHLSKIHGDANIHYVFRESDGFIKDVLKAGLIKAGYASDHAKELVRIWKAMIEEMGGVNGGGTIIHYAHSLGAADTYVAGSLLTDEERSMIKVSTFGSPQIIPAGFFGEAKNYISRWDGVCLLGPYNFIKALFFQEPHVIYLHSSEGIPWQDHPISCATYNKIMLGLSSGIVTHFGPLVLN